MYPYNRSAEGLIYHNTKAKVYPDGTRKVTYCTEAIFKEDGWELCEALKDPPDIQSKPKDMTNDPRSDNVKRAKDKVFDIALLNRFEYFVTLTLDKEKIDRFDAKAVSKVLRKSFNNFQQRYNAKYLLIPEHHKDGAIHMHGLLSGDFKLIDSGKRTKDGRPIYNLPQWKYGFSTAIEITGEQSNVAKYITKYISKDFHKIFGAFYYAGGKDLKRTPPILLYDTEYEQINAKEYTNEASGRSFKYETLGTEIQENERIEEHEQSD